MSEVKDLKPQLLWGLFDEITKVPRPSKKEEKIIKYLIDFAEKHNLEHRTDQIGNVVICRPASESMKSKPTVIVQSHMDMVCEKNSDMEFDFENDPIQTYVEDGWVKAKGTTLGADDGIGMAAALALLIDQSVEVPAIEALFTVDEETGLTGAFNLGEKMLTGKYLINLDSEDDGEIFIGCAGGVRTSGVLEYRPEGAPAGSVFFEVAVSGLKGGHSGDDINKGYANSNKLLNRFLWQAARECGLRLAKFDGGNLHNAIPREASAVVCIPNGSVAKAKELFEGFVAESKEEFKIAEPSMSIVMKEVAAEKSVIDADTQRSLLNAIQGMPNGILAMSLAMPGLVETSTNLASVKFVVGNKIELVTSQRSSVESGRKAAAAAVASVLELAGAAVEHEGSYPGWNPDPSSYLLKVMADCHKKLFGVEPKVRAIHAGLECGLFLEKYPHLEMVSVGPTLRGVHSPDERLEIETVDKFWKLLIETLKNM